MYFAGTLFDKDLKISTEESERPVQKSAVLICAMWCHEKVWTGPEWALWRQWLNLVYIEYCSSYGSSLKCGDEIFFLNSGSPTDVHEHGAILHFRES